MTIYRLETELWSTDQQGRRRILNTPHVFTFLPDLPAAGHSRFNLTLEPLGTYTKSLGGVSRFLILFSTAPIDLTITDTQLVPVAETVSGIKMVVVEKSASQFSFYNPSSTVTAELTVTYEFTPLT